MMRILRKFKNEKKRFFQENKSILWRELIAFPWDNHNHNHNPIRIFSSNQILKATNNFDLSNVVARDAFIWYRGMLEDRPVLIKKYDSFYSDHSCRDIAISSLMSGHKNVLKLLGCCLEFRNPVLVCEYAAIGVVNMDASVVQDTVPLPWNIRLKIAKEIARVVTHLHTAFPMTIVHRDIKPTIIFLDENWNAKLSSFSLSLSIPKGEESCVCDCVAGTYGFIEPEYLRTLKVTENVDVYSFGMTMLALLIGKRREGRTHSSSEYIEPSIVNGVLAEVIDPALLLNGGNDAPEHQRLQMEAFAELALRCVGFRSGEVRPKMRDVARELKQIERSTEASLQN